MIALIWRVPITYMFVSSLHLPVQWDRALKFYAKKKRYASVVYSKRTYFIRSTYQASVHCDFIPLKSFELHKTF